MKKPFYVYFVPKTHHDLGYTQAIDELLETYCGYYDDVLDFCDRTADYPAEAQYRYTVESFWSLDYYLKHTSKANRERMKDYVKSGRIEIQAFYANVIDGICSEEEIARLMYPSAAYARECGVKVTSAALTDIPGMSAGIIKALSEADVPYLFTGFPTYFEWEDCEGNRLENKKSFWDEKKLFDWGYPAAYRWKALDGGQVFAWYQFGYGHMSKVIRTVFEAEVYEEVCRELPEYIAELKAKGVPYQVMRYVDHGMDNVPPVMAISDVVRRWNQEHEDIKCIVATESMFFEALQRDCEGKTRKTVVGELPHTDYTTCSVSEAQMSALNARTKGKLSILEKLNAMSLLSGRGNDIRGPVESAYSDVILYDEHCFGMDTFGYQYEYNRSLKMNYAFRAAKKVRELWDAVKSAAAGNEENIYTLFCASGRKGKSAATLLQCGPRDKEPGNETYMLIDTAIIEPGKTEVRNMESEKTDLIKHAVLVQCDMIEDVRLPVCGLTDRYAMKLPDEAVKQYTIVTPERGNLTLTQLRPAGSIAIPEEVKCTENIFENRFYRLEFDTVNGALAGVYDKETGRYVMDKSRPAGQVLVRNIETNEIFEPKMERMYHRMSGAVADSMVLYHTVYSIPMIVTEITLYHTMKRIDFSYRLVLDRIPLREAFVVFPFQMEEPRFTFQGIGTPVRVLEDIVEGGNTNQFACQHWCKAEGKDYACLLIMDEARIIEFGGIHPTAVSQAHRHLSPAGSQEPYVNGRDMKNACMASMILYNNCQTNFPPVQQGEVIYRYSVTTGSRVQAESFAENAIYPPVILPGTMPCEEVNVDPDNLCITCFKKAENNDGFIIRIKETEGRAAEAGLSFADRKVCSAVKCTITEEDICEIAPERIPVGAYETVTVRVRF